MQRGPAGDAVALAAGLAYGWYITGTVHDGQAFIVRALASPVTSSPSTGRWRGAWGGWLTQIGSGATTSDAIDHAERRRRDRPRARRCGVSARRRWWPRCCAPTEAARSRRPS